MPNIQIYDTTLRDGAQGEGVSFSLQDKLLIARRLDSLGFDYVEGGYPLSNSKDSEFFQRMAEKPLSHARLVAFGMTRRRGVRPENDSGMLSLLNSQAPVIALVGKASDFHVTKVLDVSLAENLAMITESIKFLREAGREVIFDAEHFFDGWKRKPEYAVKTVQAAAEAGAFLVVLCDTNGGSMPDEIGSITRECRSSLDRPVGIHCHNDCDLAVANSLAAIEAGAIQVQGTINGFGERCGNADLISVIGNLALKKDCYEILGGRNIEHLTELSRYIYEMANMRYRDNQPFVGPSAFTHKGGMHAHAVSRSTSSYEHIRPEQVGNARRFLVSELSGRSNIIALTTRYHLEHNRDLMSKILHRVVELENQGYQFEAAEASFDLLVKRCAGTYEPHFELIKYHTIVENRTGDGKLLTEATVKIRVGKQVRHEVAEGDGPVNALDAALRKALNGFFPALEKMQLVDYKVRVINSEAATAACVRVMIESRDATDVWGTVGVSENIIDASWHALVDSIEYKLCKDESQNIQNESE